MANFIGEVCPICKQKFKAGDDIVVCPECGAPHHRPCYLEHGTCAYHDRHAQGWTVSKQREEDERKRREEQTERLRQQQSASPGGNVCSNCGTQNPDDGLFCMVCGNTLGVPGQQGKGTQHNPGVQSPFGGMKADDKIGEIPAKDFAAYVGSNAAYYLPKFNGFGNHNKTLSVNFTALFFPSLYYLYRKMYPIGIVFFVINLVFNVFSMILYMNGNVDISSSEPLTMVYYVMTVLSVLTFVLSILSGLFANRLYYNKAVKDIKKCQQKYTSPQEYIPALMKKGAVSLYAIAIAMVILSVVTMVMVYATLLY